MALKRLFCKWTGNQDQDNDDLSSNNSNNTRNHNGMVIGKMRKRSTCGTCSIMRVSSVDDSLHLEGLAASSSTKVSESNSNNSNMNSSNNINSKGVRFGQVLIRDYERVAGDNPSVSMGVPIGLGWQYIEYGGIDLDEYEDAKPRRSKAQLVMSAPIRQSILKKEWGVSQNEIANSVRRSIKTKNQRRQTVLQGDTEEQLLYKLKLRVQIKYQKWEEKRKLANEEKQERDHMSKAGDAMQSGSLDKTRHKGRIILAIEDVEEPGSTSTVDEISVDFR